MNAPLRILHLEDNDCDSELVCYALKRSGAAAEIRVARNQKEFVGAIESENFDVILSDSNLPGFDGTEALRMARQRHPGIPFIFVSGFSNEEDAQRKKRITGATECICKSELETLSGAIMRVLQESPVTLDETGAERAAAYATGVERLVGVIQELSLVRSLTEIMAIVRHAARELTGADGATFVLREGDQCHYADEEAIAPLWKGKRFPLNICISGWAMLNRQAAIIADIYADARIPADAYRPTFVKSLAMVPIRTAEPIGAIGVYWATKRLSQPHEIKLLRALADSTSIAMENVQLYNNLEQKVADRTTRLQSLNEELEAFSHSVSHDLQAPLRHISMYLGMVRDEPANQLIPASLQHLQIVTDAARRMKVLIEDLLEFSRTGRMVLKHVPVNMGELVEEVRLEMQPELEGRAIVWDVYNLPTIGGDRALLKQVWINLISNAVKYTRHRAVAEIQISSVSDSGETTFFVRDNGAGFDMKHADKLFGAFQRLHRPEEFEGTGIGLVNVRRIIARHNGRIWAEAKPEAGATFYFTLPWVR